VPQLVDFGHSKDAKVNSIPNSVVGTPYYQAPEIYLAQLAEEDGLPAPPYDGEKVDVWALGVMLLILLRGDYPFPITQGKQYTRDGVLHQRLQLQVAQLAVSPQCAAFVCKCFTLEPAARPTVALLAADDWITAGGAQLAAAARGPAVCEQTAAEVEDVIRRVQQGLP
jgi:serine/threonine protein kinase